MTIPHETPAWLEGWCEQAPVDGESVLGDLYSAVNDGWHGKNPEAAASLIQALAKDEEIRVAELIDAYIAGEPKQSDPAYSIARLHQIFITEFDSSREQEECRADLRRIQVVHSDAELLSLLADLTRSGYASPIYLELSKFRASAPAIVAMLHPSPLPPDDYSDRELTAAYLRHMSAMVCYLGGDLSDDRLNRVVALDRVLWADEPTARPATDFPWDGLLSKTLGSRVVGSGRLQVAIGIRKRMAAWWHAPLEVRKDWMICRLAYDLGPFVSEDALQRNSRFFAGRILGTANPRSRPERFVSLVKTAVPDTLARVYVRERDDPEVLGSAEQICDRLRSAAVGWVGDLPVSHADRVVLSERLGDMVVELGDEPGPTADLADEAITATTVCGVIRASRAATVEKMLGLHSPARRGTWRIQPFTAAAYYQASTNKIVVPWALLRAPFIGPSVPALQAEAMFGTLIAHEMAHAVLPPRTDQWDDFVEATALMDLLARLHASTETIPGYVTDIRHERELAADAIGLLWAHRAFADTNHLAQLDPRFITLWATRWRGVPRSEGRFAHIDHHPPPRLRCNLPLSYVIDFIESAVGPHVGLSSVIEKGKT